MKRLAVFCDGTWMSADSPAPTNVQLLCEAVAEAGADGVIQTKEYFPGIGTHGRSLSVEGLVDRLGGGAFGLGLTRKVREAYEWLARNYAPGDGIYVFGFSRGAYTARSLVGLIRNCGIPTSETLADLDRALARYRSRVPGSHPNAPASLAYRAGFSPEVATSEGECAWRRANGFGDCVQVDLAYLGVWDTVGALGIPPLFGGLSQLFNQRFRFHDTALTGLVRSARHAVAIDETRRAYAPSLWVNLAELNERDRRAGDGAKDPGAADDDVGPPYLQAWFPGPHGAVGGGGDIRGLSDLALAWIAEGADRAGLRLTDGALERMRADGDPAAPLWNRSRKPGLVYRLTQLDRADRDSPGALAEISQAALHRWRLSGEGEAPWRPAPLAPWTRVLDRNGPGDRLPPRENGAEDRPPPQATGGVTDAAGAAADGDRGGRA